MKLSLIVIIATVSLPTLYSPAEADSDSCVSLEMTNSGVVGLRNNYGQKLNILYCVQSANNPYRCGHGSHYRGGKGITLESGQVEFIPSSRADGDDILWAVCPFPLFVTGWNRNQGAYDCMY